VHAVVSWRVTATIKAALTSIAGRQESLKELSRRIGNLAGNST
jgi:hypothetical protein